MTYFRSIRLSAAAAASFLALGFCAYTALGDTAIPLMQMESGPSPRIQCSFAAIVSKANELTAMDSYCHGEELEKYGVLPLSRFSFDQVKNGIVFMRHRTFGMTIITMAGPDLNRREGGTIEIRYLKNAITQNFGTFLAEVVRLGDQWIVYTGADAGRRPFNRMAVTTYLLGVKKIQTN